MGGSAGAPPIQNTGKPVEVPPFGNPYQGGSIPTPVQPPQSSKGGTMAGIPELEQLFSAPQGGASVFAPSQSFPQPPINAARPAVVDNGMRLLPMPGGQVLGGPRPPVGPQPGGGFNQLGPFAEFMRRLLERGDINPGREPRQMGLNAGAGGGGWKGDPKTPNDTQTYA